jgi:hypothetical protein
MANKGTCKAEACEKEVVGKGYCTRHYKLWREGKLPKARYKTCRTEGCRKKQTDKGHCADHQKKKAEAAAAS